MIIRSLKIPVLVSHPQSQDLMFLTLGIRLLPLSVRLYAILRRSWDMWQRTLRQRWWPHRALLKQKKLTSCLMVKWFALVCATRSNNTVVISNSSCPDHTTCPWHYHKRKYLANILKHWQVMRDFDVPKPCFNHRSWAERVLAFMKWSTIQSWSQI